MADADPLAAARKLGQRVEQEFGKLGLHLELFAPIPALHAEEQDRVQCIFTCDWDEIGKDADQKKMDEDFEQMAREFARQSEEEKANAIREQLAERMRNGGSIFDAVKEEGDGDV